MRYVIIGNSATGIGAAEAIRAADTRASITIVGDEPHHVYARPLISDYVAGEMTPEQMRYRPADFYQRLNLEARLGSRADALNFDSRVVTLANGAQVHYDKLLIATGSIQKFPPIKGREHSGVFDFWTQAHAEAIRARITQRNVRAAVVVGAGLVGIQAASGLREAGLEVTLVELLPAILSRILDTTAAAHAQAILEQRGVRVLTGRSVAEILGNAAEGVSGVVLDNGEKIPCGLVIKATGVGPNLALVKGTAIATNIGILVNEYFETNVPGVYAAGDVAETYDVIRGKPFVNANWPNAHAQGRVAGLNMAGRATAYAGSFGMTSMPMFGKAIVAQGIVEPEPGDDVRVRESRENLLYRKLVFRNDRLIGAVMVDDVSAVGLVNHLIQSQKPAGAFKDALLDLGAAYYAARRAWFKPEVEGVNLPWGESLSSTERYEKHFDDEKWAERERDARKW